jgi:CRP-like cAMP-binding protein
VVVEDRVEVLALDQQSLLDLASHRPWLGVSLLTRLVQRMSSDLDRLTATEADPQPLAADLL